MDETDNWAKLITKKEEFFPAVNQVCAEVSRRAGINCAEFVCFLLNSTLSSLAPSRYNMTANIVEHRVRNLDLKGVIDAIQNQIWKKPFHVEHGRAYEGADITKSYSSNEARSPEQMAEHLKKNLSDADVTLLRDLLQKNYWDWEWESQLSRIDHVTLGRLRDAAAVFAVKFDYERQWYFDRPVKEAFRYGLI
jgi:hypothetical protein